MWDEGELMDELARDFLVIALDCRGHGLSGKPHDPDLYGAEMGEDVIRLLDHLKLPKAHLVGYSMGTRVIGKLLVTHPERFVSATLGSGVFTQWDSKAQQSAERRARRTEERGRSGQRFFWETEDQDFQALAAVLRGRRSEAVTVEEIGQITVPVLAVIGSEEGQVPAAKNLTRLLPSSKLVVINGAKHRGEQATLTHPEFLAAVREFIRSHSGSKQSHSPQLEDPTRSISPVSKPRHHTAPISPSRYKPLICIELSSPSTMFLHATSSVHLVRARAANSDGRSI